MSIVNFYIILLNLRYAFRIDLGVFVNFLKWILVQNHNVASLFDLLPPPIPTTDHTYYNYDHTVTCKRAHYYCKLLIIKRFIIKLTFQIHFLQPSTFIIKNMFSYYFITNIFDQRLSSLLLLIFCHIHKIIVVYSNIIN